MRVEPCDCGQLTDWFKAASRCYSCGGNGQEAPLVWLKVNGVCTPYHKGCAPVEMVPA